MYSFGFNGFGQITSISTDKDSVESTDIVKTPVKLKTPGEIVKGIKNKCCVWKEVSASWDSVLLISDSGDIDISGHHKNLTASLKEGSKVTSGCLLWDSIALVNHHGELLYRSLTDTDSQWTTLKLTEQKGDPHIDLDNATCVKSVVGGGKKIFALTDSQRLMYIDLAITPILRPVDLNIAVKQVSCGKEHVLILSRIGKVFSCGLGGQGQLGHGDVESHNKPCVVEALEAVSCVSVAAGGWHSIALSDIGDMYIWGWNEGGQLGFPSKHVRDNSAASREPEDGAKPQQREIQSDAPTRDDLVNILAVPALLDLGDSQEVNVAGISCGARHSAAVTEHGQLYTWGWNKYGQLGHGDTVSRDTPTLVRYYSNHTVTRVQCGVWSTFVYTETIQMDPDKT